MQYAFTLTTNGGGFDASGTSPTATMTITGKYVPTVTSGTQTLVFGNWAMSSPSYSNESTSSANGRITDYSSKWYPCRQ